ncbi:hypothetical protein [Myxococcus faecalis]|uniref:hypothetical protein n=1 Tax=Myxococcus faecalis TaxID=3115646 RepID=UPI003CE9DC43
MIGMAGIRSNDDCVEGALESIRHRLAKAALLSGLRHLRETCGPLRGEVACLRCLNPFVRELLAAGAWTAERNEVVDVGSARRPDVLALSGTVSVFLFEVHVRHRVDAEKSAVYEAGDLAGLELDAAVLLDDENRARWTGREPLGLPLTAWHLERAPRPFSICPECRGGTEEFQALAGLVGHLRRTSPQWAAHFLHKAAKRLEVSTIALQNSGPEALVQAVEAPEALRAKWGAATAEAVARKARWPSARSLLLDGLALDVDPWEDTPVVALLTNPYDALTKTALKRKAVPKEALHAADLLVRIQSLPLVAERLEAYAGRTLVQRLGEGHTASTVPDLTHELSRATRVRTDEVARWVQSAVRKGAVLATASAAVPAEGVALASVAGLEARVEEELRARRWKSPDRSDVNWMQGLSPEQRAAVGLALDFGVSVITGGPGTGKTFVIVTERAC